MDTVKPSTRIEAVDRLYDQAELGYSADVVLKSMDPVLERRLGLLLDQFQQCPPEIGPLLDLRAKIGEVWRMRKELMLLKNKGKTAVDVLQRILEVESRTQNKQSA